MSLFKHNSVRSGLMSFFAVCIIGCESRKLESRSTQNGASPNVSSDSASAGNNDEFMKTESMATESMAKINATIKELEKVINDQNRDYAVGVTSVAGKSISRITGERELTKAENDSIRKILKQEENDMESAVGSSNYIKVNGKALLPSIPRLDLREHGLATSVKDQDPAGTCWAFGAIGAYESNYKAANSLTIDASEQYAINCSGAGTSKGGLAFQVFRWMVKENKNVDDEVGTPYADGDDRPCNSVSPKTNYYAIEWEFIAPDQNPSTIPTVQQIKEAMCRYGAISASVYVTKQFQYYVYKSSEPNKNYVFKENQSFSGTNHAILLIGWDDSKNAWLLKNSWGPGWGITCNVNGEAAGFKRENSGYMWIDYDTNNVGRRAAWVRAKKSNDYQPISSNSQRLPRD